MTYHNEALAPVSSTPRRHGHHARVAPFGLDLKAQPAQNTTRDPLNYRKLAIVSSRYKNVGIHRRVRDGQGAALRDLLLEDVDGAAGAAQHVAGLAALSVEM
jgi:hypothetical protein